jgi:hypothetical protein
MCFSPCWSRPWRSPSRAADDNQDSHPVLVAIAHAGKALGSLILLAENVAAANGSSALGPWYADPKLQGSCPSMPAAAAKMARPPGSSRRGRTWRDADRPYAIIRNRANSYFCADGVILNAGDLRQFRPSGAFLSTISDLLIWDRSLRKAALLSQESADRMDTSAAW